MFTNLSLGARVGIFILIITLASATCVVAGMIVYRYVLQPSPPVIATPEVGDGSDDPASAGSPGIPDLVSSSDSGLSNNDDVTNIATPQFTGICRNDDKINLISDVDGVLSHEEIVCASSNYTVTLGTTLSDGIHRISAVATDPSGNIGQPSSELNLTIDTVSPVAPSIPDLADASDTGISNTDNVTNDITPQFKGTCTPGDMITIQSSVDGEQIPEAVCPGDSGSYDITLTSNLREVTHSISATATDTAGNSSNSQPLVVTIETMAPNAPGAPDLEADSDSGISNIDNTTNDTTPRFTGICNSGDTVSIYSSANGDRLPEVVCTDGRYDITLSNPLSEGSHSIIAKAKDGAGNTTNSLDLIIFIDTSAPPIPGTPDLAAGSDSGRSNTDNITNDTSPQFTGSCPDGERISLTSSAVGLLSPVNVFCSGGFYDITVNALFDNVTHSVYAQATDAAGNTSAASGGLGVTIDTAAPSAPGTPDLAAGSDTGGSDTDNVTSDTTPQFAGSCATGDEVNLYSSVHGVLSPSDFICSGDFYDITLTSALSATTHNITALAIDLAGNVSPYSSALSVTIGSTTPAAPGTPDLASGSDSGVSNTDNITKVTSPQFTGTCTDGDKINLSSNIDGALNPSDTVCSSGSYSITLTSTLTQTTHNITATATNTQGTSPASGALGVTVDTTAPAQPGIPDLSAGSDTGSSNTDNITSDTTPQFTGTCESGTVVNIISSTNGSLSPTGTCSGGVYDITVTTVLSQDSHDFTATQADTAGNTSSASGILEVKIVIPTLAISVSGNIGSDAVTSSGGTPSDGHLNCPSVRCDTDYLLDDSVTLNVVVDAASSFSGWSGDCASFGANLSGVITMNDNKNCTATFSALTFPEMDVEGNSTSIPDGDTTPNAGDFTDFGNVTVGSTLDRTFSIQNEGANTLSLTNFPTAVTLSGSGDFSIQSQPSSGTIASGGGDLTFVVRCTPSSVATVTTTVSIANNDSDENPYDFTLSCNGVAAPAPEMDVEGNSASIADGDASPDTGDHTDFGNVNVGSSLDRTFTIQNEGTDTLNLTNFPTAVTLSGSGDFSVQTQPGAGSIASGGGDLTFVVRCTPSGVATVTTTVSIANNDSDENPYDFVLSCNGVAAPAPEMDVEGNGVSIADGDASPDAGEHTDFGNVNVGSSLDRTFTIQNEGTDTLNLTDFPTAVTLSGSGDFSVQTQPSAGSIAAGGGDLTFVVRCTPSAAGAVTTTVSIANNDADENPYDFGLSCTGVVVPAPEIDVQRPASTSIADGGTVDLGNHDTGSATLLFTLDNSAGTAQLSVSGVSASNLTNVSNFALNSTTPIDIPAGETGTFEISFDIDSEAAFSLEIDVANDDSDENPYDILISGTGAAAPEMDVEGNDKVIYSGDISPDTADHTDFGNVDTSGATVTRTFVIKNTGTNDLTLSDSPIVTIGGTHASDFTLTADATTPVTGGDQTTFKITFDPSDSGVREATISIANNDGDENPYTFDIQGTGTGAAPEMDVLGNSISIASGDTSPDAADQTDFGSADVATGLVTYTFTIQNSGSVDLNLSGSPIVTIGGTHAADFILNTDATTPVASGGGTTTFQISFDPSDSGLREATVSIANDDNDENPYTFSIQGTGTP